LVEGVCRPPRPIMLLSVVTRFFDIAVVTLIFTALT
jgi:hypothetical protein